METCLLCLEANNESEGNIKVNSTQWQELNVKNLIDRHFWPVMQTIQLSAWLCQTCWEKLQDFHKFYVSVENAHSNLDSILKLKTSNETHLETDILLQETHAYGLITEELNIIIKKEDDKNITDEEYDDTPPVSISKLKRQAPLSPDKSIIEDPLHTSRKPKQNKITRKAEDTSKNEKILDEQILEINEASDDDFNIDTDSTNELDDQDSLIKNKRMSHSNRSKGINDAKNKFIADNFKLICNICLIPIETFQELLKHFKAEHQQNGYVLCCAKKFFKRNFFLDHLHHHVDPKYLKCEQCDKILKNSRCLKTHKRVHETNRSKNHCCDICGLNFFTRHGLYSHKTRHLTDEEKMFSCPKCIKKFGTKSKLLDHVKKVHGTNEVCDICGLILVNKSALNKHKLLKHTHQEKRDYICQICSKISPNQHSLTTHINNVHKRGYNHKCTICDRAFKIPKALKEHMATHTGTDLYACPWCPRTCKSNAYMHTHRKKCHPKEWAEEKRKKYSGNLPPDVKITLEHIIND